MTEETTMDPRTVTMLQRLRNFATSTAPKLALRALRTLRGTQGLTLTVDRFWCDEHHLAVQGWIADEKQPIEALEVRAGTSDFQQATLAPRPDVKLNPRAPEDATRGFCIQIRHAEPMRLRLRVKRAGRWTRLKIKHSPPECTEQLNVPPGGKLFDQFVKEVNQRHLHVLEIGSRIVSPGSSSKRDLFPHAASFTGFDYYPDENTDLVGDAHRLSELVGERKFDAVFSVAVLEHLAMPWVVAREINRVLQPGGLTFHGTLFAWPAHERPWDFWRFSDEGLKVLFSPVLGYEILGAGMFDPVSMHFREQRPGHESFPHAAAFASSSILARKIEDVSPDEFRWPSNLAPILGQDSHYPEAR